MVAHISGKKSFGSYVWYTVSISEQGKKHIADKKESSISQPSDCVCWITFSRAFAHRHLCRFRQSPYHWRYAIIAYGGIRTRDKWTWQVLRGVEPHLFWVLGTHQIAKEQEILPAYTLALPCAPQWKIFQTHAWSNLASIFYQFFLFITRKKSCELI